MASQDCVLSVRDVVKTYDNKVKALQGVSFDVRQGEFIAVLGASGSGKSTLIRAINHLIPITSGEVIVGGKNIHRLRGQELRKARQRIGMIFQHYNLVDRLTVMQNVMHGVLGAVSTLSSVLGLYSEEQKREALGLLADLGLGDYAYKKAGELSGGQKQRVGIARALMQAPDILLCDEPISSLDPITARVIMDLLSEMAEKRGIACIVNLHQVDVALQYASRVVGIAGGKLAYNGASSGVTKEDLERIYGGEIPTSELEENKNETRPLPVQAAGGSSLAEAAV